MLCERCRALSLPLISHEHAKSLDALKTSALGGCHLCSLLWQAVSQEMRKPEFPDGWHSLACTPGRERPIHISTDWLNNRINIECPDLLHSIARSLGSVALFPISDSDSEGLVKTTCMGKQVLQSSDSNEAFNLIRSWMKNCLKNHGCKRAASSMRSPPGPSKRHHPTRLIDVGASDNSSEPRLIETSQILNAKDKYAALSHCWGQSQPATTTTSTLRDRIKGIEFSTLPKTFQDAIRITRILGIRYLWIDSLCILQDSIEDWRAESATMGQIYTKSHITICAAGAEDSHKGCFIPRPSPKIGPCDLGSGIYAAEFIEEIPLYSPEAVDSRAWCLQEIALAPRVLMYGSRMMSWLCDSGVETEQGRMPSLSPKYGPRFRSNDWDWSTTVSDYTRRSLSEEKDKLVAISGLARRYGEKTKGLLGHSGGSNYLAGLWRKTLITGLLWRVNIRTVADSKLVRRSISYRSPSWSWACLDGPILFHSPWKHDYLNIQADIIVASVQLATNDEYGEVIGARLQIAGPCAEVRCRNTTSTVYPACFPLSSGPDSEFTASGCASCWFDVRHERDWSATLLLCLRVTGNYGLLLLPVDEGYHLRVGISTWTHSWDLESPRREVSII